MNYDEISLNLINEWELGEYRHHSQKKANLQCRITEALENVALSRKRESSGWAEKFNNLRAACCDRKLNLIVRFFNPKRCYYCKKKIWNEGHVLICADHGKDALTCDKCNRDLPF